MYVECTLSGGRSGNWVDRLHSRDVSFEEVENVGDETAIAAGAKSTTPFISPTLPFTSPSHSPSPSTSLLLARSRTRNERQESVESFPWLLFLPGGPNGELTDRPPFSHSTFLVQD